MSPAGPGPPELLSILVCDLAYRDTTTGKCYILGTFSRIAAQTFPYTHPRLSVALALTNGHGTAKTELRLVMMATNQPVLAIKDELRFTSPLQVVEGIIDINNVTFPEAGIYSFDLYIDGELIGQKSFLVGSVTGGATP